MSRRKGRLRQLCPKCGADMRQSATQAEEHQKLVVWQCIRCGHEQEAPASVHGRIADAD